MLSAPKVSILLSVFNRTQFLAQSIRSALEQTYPHLELLVTDDSPTGQAGLICKAFACDSRLRYRRNKATLGPAGNFLAALREATGEFVVLFNDDDLMEPWMLEKLLPPLKENPGCDLSFSEHWIIDTSGALLRKETERNSRHWGRAGLAGGRVTDTMYFALKGGIPLVMGTLLRRSALREQWFVPEVEGAYDWWLALQLASGEGGLMFVPDRVFRYRVHDNTESARAHPEKLACLVYVLSEVLKKPMVRRDRALARRLLALFLFALGRDRLYFGYVPEAREAFLRSWHQRCSIKACAGLAATWLPLKATRASVENWRRLRGISQPLPSEQAPTP